jgi:hypothetical protein
MKFVQLAIVICRAGTAGTGRVHPRRAAGRAGTASRRVRRAQVDGFFFQNHTLSVPVAGTTGTGTGVLGHG